MNIELYVQDFNMNLRTTVHPQTSNSRTSTFPPFPNKTNHSLIKPHHRTSFPKSTSRPTHIIDTFYPSFSRPSLQAPKQCPCFWLTLELCRNLAVCVCTEEREKEAKKGGRTMHRNGRRCGALNHGATMRIAYSAFIYLAVIIWMLRISVGG